MIRTAFGLLRRLARGSEKSASNVVRNYHDESFGFRKPRQFVFPDCELFLKFLCLGYNLPYWSYLPLKVLRHLPMAYRRRRSTPTRDAVSLKDSDFLIFSHSINAI
jgi:hypothetical protein